MNSNTEDKIVVGISTDDPKFSELESVLASGVGEKTVEVVPIEPSRVEVLGASCSLSRSLIVASVALSARCEVAPLPSIAIGPNWGYHVRIRNNRKYVSKKVKRAKKKISNASRRKNRKGK